MIALLQQGNCKLFRGLQLLVGKPWKQTSQGSSLLLLLLIR